MAITSPASTPSTPQRLAKGVVRWGMVVVIALGVALIIDLARSSLAPDRVAWGTLKIEANRVVPVAASAKPDVTDAARPLSNATPDRPQLIRFTADWCGPCQTMKAEVFAQPHIADAIHSRFSPYSVDLSQPTPQQEALGQYYRVVYLPTLIIADAEGRELARLDQAADADEFMDWLERGWARWYQDRAAETPATGLSPVSHDQPLN